MKLDLNEIELLLQVYTADFCDYGASEQEREKFIAEWRSKIGYSAYHLKMFNKQNKVCK